MIVVDLKTTYVPNSLHVWRCFPGKGYRFLEHFRSGLIFVDVPDLELQEGRPVGADSHLRARVAASRAHAFQLRGLIEPTVTRPSWCDFTQNQVDPQLEELVASVENFYDKACPGDIVIVPEPELDAHILFGRILTDRYGSEATYYERQYGPSRLDGKRVEWMVRINQKFLTPALRRALRQENNFTPIDIINYAEVLSVCFNNFMWKDLFGSTLRISGQDFNLYDNAMVGFVNSLTASACDRSSSDETEIVAGHEIDFFDMITRNHDVSGSSEMELDVHLPGYFRLLSKNVTPIAVAGITGLMISLGSCTSLAEFQSELPRINFINPQAGRHGQHCAALVHAAIAAIFDRGPQHKLWKLCKKLKSRAHQSGAGLDPHVHVFRDERSSSPGRLP